MNTAEEITKLLDDKNDMSVDDKLLALCDALACFIAYVSPNKATALQHVKDSNTVIKHVALNLPQPNQTIN